MRKFGILLAFSIACASFGSNAAAQSDKSVAEALFRAGKDLEKQGKVAEACAKYAESHRLDPKPGTILNVATCHESLGKTATAWADFGEAATFAARAHQADREKFARQHAKDLEKKLSYVTFKFPDTKGLEVTLDGKSFSASGTRLPLDPGEHAVTASAAGKLAWSKTLQVEPGPKETTFEIPALEDDTTKAEPVSPPVTKETDTTRPLPGPNNTQRTLGWVSLGVGVVGLGVGAYFGYRTLQNKSDRDAHCVEDACDQAGVDFDRDARTTATASTIGFVAGGVLAVTGVVLVLTSPSGGRSSSIGRTLVRTGLTGTAAIVW